jgi:hypothetical protein
LVAILLISYNKWGVEANKNQSPLPLRERIKPALSEANVVRGKFERLLLHPHPDPLPSREREK